MNNKKLKVMLHPTIRANCSFSDFQNFFYHKHKLTQSNNITPVVTQETQNNILKKITTNIDNPKYRDLLSDVERFVTIDSNFKDLIFCENFSLGQVVSVEDYGWPHTNQISMNAVVTGLGLNDILYVSPLTYDFELGSNKSTILNPEDTNIGEKIAILNEFQTPVFNSQLVKSDLKLNHSAIEKIQKTSNPENSLESFTGIPIKRKSDWRFSQRNIIVNTSLQLGRKANEFIMDGPSEINKFLNIPDVDYILTYDKDILESKELIGISTDDYENILVSA